uniref:Uncharacterized protein n=1 Tax=Rhizophora mucronata TaxID=61149 RepID=A0A2P2NNB4_RHIMU
MLEIRLAKWQMTQKHDRLLHIQRTSGYNYTKRGIQAEFLKILS